MITKLCTKCGEVAPHNEMKKAGEYRCTYCGYPNVFPATSWKKPHYDGIMERLVKRAALMRSVR